MTIGELIAELEKLKTQHGDVQVVAEWEQEPMDVDPRPTSLVKGRKAFFLYGYHESNRGDTVIVMN